MPSLSLRPIASLSDVTVAVPQTVLSQELDGDLVLLDVENGEYYGLDEIGSHMWKLLSANENGPAEVLQVLLETYEAPRDRLVADLKGFIAMLDHFRLLQIGDPEATSE